MEKVNLADYLVSQCYVDPHYEVVYKCSSADWSKVEEALMKAERYWGHRWYRCVCMVGGDVNDGRSVVRIMAHFMPIYLE